MGFTVRRQSGKLLIKPSKAALRRIRERLRTEMRALRGANAAMVLVRLNPIIRGWAAYYRTAVSSEAFSALDRYLWRLTYKWAKHGHPNKSKHWIVNRYFGAFNKSRRDRWVFGDRDSGAYRTKFAWTGIVRHRMVKGGSSPDDPALAQYWADRRRRGATPAHGPAQPATATEASRALSKLRGPAPARRPPAANPIRMGAVGSRHGKGAAQAEPHPPEARRVGRDQQPPSRTRPMPRRHTPPRHRPSTSACPRAFGACLSRMRGNRARPVLRGAGRSNAPGLPGELVGNYANGGAEWGPAGRARAGQRPRLQRQGAGQGHPYGVYDMAADTGWVTVGTDPDTGQFAGRRSAAGGTRRQPPTRRDRLLITADGGGSNGCRLRLWKTELAGLAAETGLAITVCHLPPGTTKWNKIEHRLFSHISMNWRGRPLISHEVIIEPSAPSPPAPA